MCEGVALRFVKWACVAAENHCQGIERETSRP